MIEDQVFDCVFSDSEWPLTVTDLSVSEYRQKTTSVSG